MSGENEITRLLAAHRRGDREAGDQLLERIYGDLRVIAYRQLGRGSAGRTLNATALVHEAYLKIAERPRGEWQDRVHFFAVAARAMRHILVDHARAFQAEKRGGKAQRTDLRASVAGGDELSVEVLDLHAGLSRLGELNPRLSRIVELRFFGGLSLEETAEVLGVSRRTIDRDWVKAKGLLTVMLDSGEGLER